MPKNEEGEFELVLGNRQLLSGFFIVVILFGIFFTMGYIVGRHSAPPGTVETVGGAGVPRPSPVERSEAPATETHRSEPPPPEPAAPATTAAVVEPAQQEPPEPRREETKKKRAEASAPVAAEPAGAAGTYLQVAAPKRAAADGVVVALKKREIVATLLPGPDENTVRVVVGPFADPASMGKMRAELEKAGFKPFIKKVN
ncbi:MAG: SPOR domain-containing protein [Bryobacteraceae bacterium]